MDELAIESAFESIRKPTGRMPEEVAQSIREQIQALVDAKEDSVIRRAEERIWIV